MRKMLQAQATGGEAAARTARAEEAADEDEEAWGCGPDPAPEIGLSGTRGPGWESGLC